MIEKVEAYVREHYKRMYGDKPLIIQEFDSNESPLILGKSIVDE